MAAGDILLPTCAGACTCVSCTLETVYCGSVIPNAGRTRIYCLATASPAIVPPTVCPSILFFYTGGNEKVTAQPGFQIHSSGAWISGTYGWTFNFYYDVLGLNTIIYTASGSIGLSGVSAATIFLPTTGWTNTGSNWEWIYSGGTVSSSTTPECMYEFLFSGSVVSGASSLGSDMNVQGMGFYSA